MRLAARPLTVIALAAAFGLAFACRAGRFFTGRSACSVSVGSRELLRLRVSGAAVCSQFGEATSRGIDYPASCGARTHRARLRTEPERSLPQRRLHPGRAGRIRAGAPPRPVPYARRRWFVPAPRLRLLRPTAPSFWRQSVGVALGGAGDSSDKLRPALLHCEGAVGQEAACGGRGAPLRTPRHASRIRTWSAGISISSRAHLPSPPRSAHSGKECWRRAPSWR